jgi:hypothetical protein
MTLPADIQETVTRELSTVMEVVIDSYEAQGHGPATLVSVREAMAGGILEHLAAENRVHLEDKSNLLLEIDSLIEGSGGDAFAVRFTRPRASEDLSTVIEALLDSTDYGYPPTLSTVRDAMQQGLLANLVGHGQLDSEDEQSLLDEIDAMIERHGVGALAEEFLHYY